MVSIATKRLVIPYSLDIFDRLKTATDWLPFKDRLGGLYRPLLQKMKYRVENKRFRAGGQDALLAAHAALGDIDVPFWLDFGTLLGITRDGGLIKHDTDVDIAVLHDDFSPEIREAMIQRGFVLTDEYLVQDGRAAREECYTYRGVGLDIFYYHRDEKQMWCHLFPLNDTGRFIRELRMTWTGFKPFPYAGVDWLVPGDYHQRLVDTYGLTYNIPDPNFYTPDDAHNSRVLDVPCTHLKHDQ